MLKIGVCVKAVINPETFDPKKYKDVLRLDEASRIPNECDRYAVQEAVKLREHYGGEVIVISVGSKYVMETIYDSLARGADKAIHIDYKEPFPEDPFLTASLIYRVVKEMRFDLIMCGAESVDNATSMTPAILSELLGFSYIWGAKKIKGIADGKIALYREVTSSLIEELEIKLPAVLAVQSGADELRYVSFAALRAASKKEIKTVSPEICGAEIIRLWNIKAIYLPLFEKKAIIIEGNEEEVAKKFTKILREMGVF